jgi:hypothetical protein
MPAHLDELAAALTGRSRLNPPRARRPHVTAGATAGSAGAVRAAFGSPRR